MSDQPWKFRRISFNGGRLEADIGPGVPRVDIEPLDLPPAPPSDRCWLCLGKGDDGDGSPCPNCEGTGQRGGQP